MSSSRNTSKTIESLTVEHKTSYQEIEFYSNRKMSLIIYSLFSFCFIGVTWFTISGKLLLPILIVIILVYFLLLASPMGYKMTLNQVNRSIQFRIITILPLFQCKNKSFLVENVSSISYENKGTDLIVFIKPSDNSKRIILFTKKQDICSKDEDNSIIESIHRINEWIESIKK